jgi:hypothetical protein
MNSGFVSIFDNIIGEGWLDGRRSRGGRKGQGWRAGVLWPGEEERGKAAGWGWLLADLAAPKSREQRELESFKGGLALG